MKLADVRDAVAAGADEIDMVIDRGAFLAGRYLKVYDEITAVREACGTSARLKVIFETGELSTYDNIRRASWLGMLAGADFIKTSTGKVAVNATPANTLLMLEAVRDFRERTGVQIGVKRPAASAPPRTRSSSSSWSTRPRARTGWTTTGSASAPPRS